MKKPRKFKFPTAVLNSINECTQGYFLVTITSDREFEVFQNIGDTVDHLSMIHFLDVHTQVMKDAVIDGAARNLNKRHSGEDDDEAGKT